MKQIPNYVVALDFIQNRVVKIKLSDEDKQFASSCDDLEELVEALSEVYHLIVINNKYRVHYHRALNLLRYRHHLLR